VLLRVGDAGVQANGAPLHRITVAGIEEWRSYETLATREGATKSR